MYFSKLPYILYRDYPDFGYLTDNRNFGYDTASKSGLKVGDRILSKTGSVFYSALLESGQTDIELAEKLLPLFRGVTLEDLKTDVKEFFLELANDGFVCCGEESSSAVLYNYFSYDNRTRLVLAPVEDNKTEGHALQLDWGTEFRLSRVHIDVSGLCNEHCAHCYFPDTFRRKIMPLNLFKAILEQCKVCNVLNITLSGGEPMLNPHLMEFIRLCREGNYSINLLSNLTLLTEEMVLELEKIPLLSIQTSLYSMNESIHDAITTTRGSFVKTKNAIELLRKHNIPMQINCPIMKQNKDSYHEVLEWARALNIEASSDYMLFGCFDGSGKNLEFRLDIKDVERIIQKERQNNRNGIQSDRSAANKEIRRSEDAICPVCTTSLCVSHTGEVYPCEGWQSLVLGNVKAQTLYSIWEESPEVKRLRSLTYEDFPGCRICEDRDVCSVCLIRNVNESSNLDYRDVNPYFCEIARLKKRLAMTLGNN